MEKKTIGKFISALRRAAGLTQKELGEKLFVSDKTVSRWERDECTPELALLPAIAEIFGITTDELLRGERGVEVTPARQTRTDKQFKAMLRSAQVRFRNCSMVSVGIALAALILAVVLNISFWKGVLACGIGTVVCLAAVICQLCVTSSALLPLDEEDPHAEEIRHANSGIITGAAGVLLAIGAMFAFLVPMGTLGGSNYGLNLQSLLLFGIGAAVGNLVVLYLLYMLAVRPILERRGLILRTEADEKRHGLLKRTLIRGGAVLLALIVAFAAVQVTGPELYAKQTDTFNDVEEFQTFMHRGAVELWKEEIIREQGPDAVDAPSCVFIDVGQDGHYEDVIFPPDFDQQELVTADGQVICSYTHYGPFVRSVRCKMDPQTQEVTITAYTRDKLQNAEQIFDTIRQVIAVLMIVNVLAWSAVYIVKALCKR